MKKIRITAMRKAYYPDLIEKHENPIEHACDIQEGQVWIANGWPNRMECATAHGRACQPL